MAETTRHEMRRGVRPGNCALTAGPSSRGAPGTGVDEMSHSIRHASTHHGPSRRCEMRRVGLWITLHRQLCECCGVALWGRRYTNAAYQAICRTCYQTGLPVSASHEADPESSAATQEESET